MKHKQYQTILFDVDGTLLDFEASERTGICQVLKTLGISPTTELEKRYSEINEGYWKRFERGEVTREQIVVLRHVDFFRTMGMDVDGNEIERIYRRWLNESAVLLEGALEICEYLKSRYQMYVVTNGVSETQHMRLAASRLDQYFADIFVSEETGSQKPQKEYFEYCFSKIPKANPSTMLIVGDSLSSDIKGGNIAGIDTCWVNPGNLKATVDIHVDYEIKRLAELKEFL